MSPVLNQTNNRLVCGLVPNQIVSPAPGKTREGEIDPLTKEHLMKAHRKRDVTPQAVVAVAVALAITISLSGCGGYTQGAASSPPPNNSPSDLYVATTGSDSNDGSSASPWRSLAHAATAVAPGDTVHVLPGAYNESVFLDISGTSSQRIRFISDTPLAAQVSGDGSGSPAFQIRKANYVDIVDFEVTNVNGFIGIESLASYSRITGNLVHNVSGGCKLGQLTLGGAGINLAYPGHDVDVIGNVVHDVGDYLNPHGCEATHGIYVENASSPNIGGYSTRAWNNIIFHNETDGITSWHCASQMVLVNNLSFENGRSGIAVGASGSGCMNNNSVVNNNILIHNGYHDFCTYSDPAQCPIGNHSGSGGIYEVGSTGPNNTYWNDLSYQNLFNGSVDDTIHLLTGTQQSPFTGIDPQLVNYQPDGTGDYHLSPLSPAVDKGTSTSAPSYDFANYPRPYGPAVDVGPYEWHP